MNCVDCKAAGVEVVATRIHNGKGYCSSHARKYFAEGMALPPENPRIQGPQISHKEEKGMPLVKGLNREEIVQHYKSGMSVGDIARKLGCRYDTVAYHLSNAGVRGRPPKRSRPAVSIREAPPLKASHVSTNRLAIVRSGPPASETAPTAAALSTQEPVVPHDARVVPHDARNGHIRCRVAMFEVEGSETAVRDAVNAIKAALENRSAGGEAWR